MYEFACVCGKSVKGSRAPRYRKVKCVGCGKSHVVFPVSLYRAALPLAPAEPAPPAKAAAKARPWVWRWPLVAGAGVLAVLAVAFAVALPYLSRPAGPPPDDGAAERRAAEDAREARSLLSQGKAHKARSVLLPDRAGGIPAALRRERARLYRQADVLSRLSPFAAEELARHASLARDADEWDATFADYRGRWLLFDDTLRRDAEDRPVFEALAFPLPGGAVRVALEDLRVFADAPLDGRRWIFAARLRAVEREADGTWAVRFHPDAVLLTDEEALEAYTIGPVDDDARETVKRQRRAWDVTARPVAE